MEVGIITVCLILSAFFSGMEIAFVSSNKIYLEIEKKQDDFISKILTKLTRKPSKFIASMLVGNTITRVIFGFFMGDLLMNWFIKLGLNLSDLSNIFLQIIISTLVVLLTSAFLPKVFFQIYANSFLKIFALPAYFFYTMFYYISSFLIGISDFVLKKFFKTEGDQITLSFSKVELGNYITEQMNSIEDNQNIDSEIQIFQNALEFSGVKARDIMTPRTELVAVDLHSSVVELRELFIKTGYSKILIYHNTLDDIIGYVHSFELFKKPRTIKSILIPVEFVPETVFIKDTMDLLTKKRKSVAVVLDEYGGTSGIITMEDIVEELFGEIEDEHDSDEALVEQQIEKNSFLFSARHDVAYLNETYKLNIPENDSYSTLGGFIVDFSKEIPQKGTQFTIGNFQLSIEAATNKKIEIVKMSWLD